MSKTPAIGDAVYFEGLVHRITSLQQEGFVFASELTHERGLKTRPRFRTSALRADLRWSEELRAWYLWGRLLCKKRGATDPNDPKKLGAVGCDERWIVIQLRDRGILPARTTRRPGQAPAGGEHVNLCCALFRRGIDWDSEIDRLRRGDALSEPATAAVEDYKKRFKQKLPEGYAAPDVGDSWAEGEK